MDIRSLPIGDQDGDEADAVKARYARRHGDERRYSPLNPAVLFEIQGRQRAMASLFLKLGWRDLATVRLLEVGCGTGENLLDFLRFGFRPELLQGIELLPGSVERARAVLPAAVKVACGDAMGPAASSVGPSSHDVVYQSTVFSSLLDDAFQKRLADRMWGWVRPGGGVLWYDFVVNNPRNPDVRGVPVARIRQLFPHHGRLQVRRLTLAPPIARTVTRWHPMLYPLLNASVWLRTHVLVWVEKPK